MNSSTSNSNPPKPRPMLVLLCSVIVVVSFAMARPKPTSFSNPSWYWQTKAEWKKCANIVLSGNSRTYRGLSPVEFEKVLGGTAVNAGFAGGTYSEEYCDYLAALFDDDDRTPNILVAGITYRLLCDLDRATGFEKAIDKTKSSIFSGKTKKKIAQVTTRFSSTVDLNRTINNNNYIQKFHLNGWVESDYLNHDVEKHLNTYRKQLVAGKRQCTNEGLSEVADRFLLLRSKGIEVYCVWLPTAHKMSELENTFGEIKKQEIVQYFREHDFPVLVFDDKDFVSYDGSHLAGESSAKFSVQTSNQIASIKHEGDE